MQNQEDKFVTTSHDSFLKVIDLKSKNIVKSFKVCDLSISTC